MKLPRHNYLWGRTSISQGVVDPEDVELRELSLKKQKFGILVIEVVSLRRETMEVCLQGYRQTIVATLPSVDGASG